MSSRIAPKSMSEISGEATALAQPSAPEERLLSRVEVCERTGKSYPTLWQWMIDGKFPRTRDLNGRPVWLKSEIDEFMRTLPVQKLKGEYEPGSEPTRLKRRAKSGSATRLEERAR